jgi:hypothetical protein
MEKSGTRNPRNQSNWMDLTLQDGKNLSLALSLDDSDIFVGCHHMYERRLLSVVPQGRGQTNGQCSCINCLVLCL